MCIHGDPVKTEMGENNIHKRKISNGMEDDIFTLSSFGLKLVVISYSFWESKKWHETNT